MRAILALSLAALIGCGGLSAAGRAQAKRSAAEEAALKTRVENILNGYRRALKGKIWDSVASYYYKDDGEALRILKFRTDALWKRGQLLDLTFEVKRVVREKGAYNAQVTWQRSLLERKDIHNEEGKCEINFRKTDDGEYLIFGVSKDAFF